LFLLISLWLYIVIKNMDFVKLRDSDSRMIAISKSNKYNNYLTETLIKRQVLPTYPDTDGSRLSTFMYRIYHTATLQLYSHLKTEQT